MRITYESELYHYGVKGQRWGVRRYQNKDGTLTKRGEKRLRKLEDVKNNQIAIARNRRQGFSESAEIEDDYIRRLKDGGPDGDELKKIYQLSDNDDDNVENFGMTRKEIYEMEVSLAEKKLRTYQEAAKQYLAKEQAIMAMNINDLTVDKKDIIEVGRRAFWNAND